MACFAGSVFYVCTRGYFGGLEWGEFFSIVVRFYVFFMLFSMFSLLLTLIPLGFQNANTLFSVLSFLSSCTAMIFICSVNIGLTVLLTRMAL